MNTNPYLGRFLGEPSLVAPHLAQRFEACMDALAASADLSALPTHSGPGNFWTELGETRSARLRPYVVEQGVLLVPIKGALLHGFPYQYADLATGYEYIDQAIMRGLSDADVKGIALIVDSPGGMVAGNFDLVDKIFAARGEKPMRAIAAEAAYSAAYSIASAADSIVVTRTGGVGSIGVVTMHADFSKALHDAGVKITFIHAGKHKVDGNSVEPLPDDVKARIQNRVDSLRDMFVELVARNRGLAADAVRSTEALTFTAQESLTEGLADRVGALEFSLAEFAAELSTDTGETTMSEIKTAMTVEKLKADHPDVAKTLIAEGREQGKADAETAAKKETEAQIQSALSADRERVAKITALAEPGAEKIVADGIASGASAGDVAYQIATSDEVKTARRNGAQLSALEEDDADMTAARPSRPSKESQAANNPLAQARDLNIRAEEYRRSEAAKGNKISAFNAVNHVSKEMDNV